MKNLFILGLLLLSLIGCSKNTFSKTGNNGTASCDVFCKGAEWGPIRTCVAVKHATKTDLTCDEVPGFDPVGYECICAED